MALIGIVGLKGRWSTEQLMRAVREKTGQSLFIDIEKTILNFDEGTVEHEGQDLSCVDAIIVKKLGENYSPSLLERIEMLRFLESKGVRIFSRPDSMAQALNRLTCTLLLRMSGIPMPPTCITESTHEAEKAVAAYKNAILKPIYTSKARGMVFVKDDDCLKERLHDYKSAGNDTIYVQKAVNTNGRDLGIVFLGGKYLATYSRVSAGRSWNTTTLNGGKYEPYKPSKEAVDVAFRAQSVFGLDFTCVDLAETEEGCVVFEVSAFGGFRGLAEACELDVAPLYAEYVLNELK